LCIRYDELRPCVSDFVEHAQAVTSDLLVLVVKIVRNLFDASQVCVSGELFGELPVRDGISSILVECNPVQY